MSDGLDLNQLGVLEGTDKSSCVSFGWDYLRHYEALFAPWRDEPINLIEIGVENGKSLEVWKGFFSRAQIVGVDINPTCARLASGRAAVEIGSQEDPVFLRRLVDKYPPTLVIDDGSHQAHHIIYSFEQLFPYLAPGGLYVIEDLDFHFGDGAQRWAAVEGYNAPQYFLDLASACLTRKNRGPLFGTRRHLVQNTDRVSFFNSAVCIHKKKGDPQPADVAAANAYVARRALGAGGLARYAKYMRENGHDATAVLAVARDRILAGETADVDTFKTIAELERHYGQIENALKTLAKGSERHVDNQDILWRMGHWLIEVGRRQDGLRHLARAAAVCPDPPRIEGIVKALLDLAARLDERPLAAELLQRAAQDNRNPACRAAIAKGARDLAG